jgi:hypothetical protein
LFPGDFAIGEFLFLRCCEGVGPAWCGPESLSPGKLMTIRKPSATIARAERHRRTHLDQATLSGLGAATLAISKSRIAAPKAWMAASGAAAIIAWASS